MTHPPTLAMAFRSISHKISCYAPASFAFCRFNPRTFILGEFFPHIFGGRDETGLRGKGQHRKRELWAVEEERVRGSERVGYKMTKKGFTNLL